ncbi:BID domain-containing T4SS effector [Bartonella koehlerae]|uniref:Bartonella effector protein BID domain-containing protein n=1 Tax=Bartonella koehlerae C-29 TaxID=1134510 RepID=A0A067WBA3_9HYPH|nr:BID domain-containing T4SS effector [Bartonella koehlerae]KEC54048.1 hypothetical protein O9A_01438 [Bartonella koehlerae C-29]
MKKHQSPPPTSHSAEKEREHEQERAPSPASEPLYAKVNKPPREQQPQKSEETVTVYAPQNPSETIYAPQRPLGNPYDRLGGRPSNGRRAERLVDPYAVTDVQNLDKGPDFQSLENPIYEGVGGGGHGGRNPRKSEEHVYAELEFGEQSGRSLHNPVESVYATVGIGTQDGQNIQTLENPLYEGVGGRITPPPRTQKDEVTTRLLKNVDFQYGVAEIQERCAVVYGNRHALNKELAEILDNPQGADKILWNLAANPESAGKLAGQKVLGIKSPGRREAEEGFGPLCSALERHVETAKKLHKAFTREHDRQRDHASPERHGHRHHHRHHSQEREQAAPEQETQRRQSPKAQRGRAFAM